MPQPDPVVTVEEREEVRRRLKELGAENPGLIARNFSSSEVLNLIVLLQRQDQRQAGAALDSQEGREQGGERSELAEFMSERASFEQGDLSPDEALDLYKQRARAASSGTEEGSRRAGAECDGSGIVPVEIERTEPDCCGNVNGAGECRGDCAVPRQVTDTDYENCPGCPRCQPVGGERPELRLEVQREGWTAQNSRASWEPVDRAPTADEIAVAGDDGYFWHEGGGIHSHDHAGPGATLYRIVQPHPQLEQGEPGLKLSVDLELAKERGVCPCCEGYGGGDAPEGHEDSTCTGVCPECWCPGCHDGHDFPAERIKELDDENPVGSWLAFELIHGPNPPVVSVYQRPPLDLEATRELVNLATQHPAEPPSGVPHAPDQGEAETKGGGGPAGGDQGSSDLDPRLKLMGDALRLIAAVHWDEDLGWLADLEEEDEKYIGASDWHCGDLGERGFLSTHGLPSGEYTTDITGSGDRFFKEALVEAIRITQPGMLANDPAPTDNQDQDRYTVDRVTEEADPERLKTAFLNAAAADDASPLMMAAAQGWLEDAISDTAIPAPADGEEGGSDLATVRTELDHRAWMAESACEAGTAEDLPSRRAEGQALRAAISFIDNLPTQPVSPPPDVQEGDREPGVQDG